MPDLRAFSWSRRRSGGARIRRLLFVFVAVLAEVAGIWLRTGRLGGEVVVRCRRGHLFTTIWIPAVSVKSLRLGPQRLQHCPVGRHWTLVTPVSEAELTDAERQQASAIKDIRLP